MLSQTLHRWVLVCAVLASIPQPSQAESIPARKSSELARPLEAHSPSTAVKLVASQKGRPRMVVLYASTCARSRAAFPKLIELAERHAGKASILAFGVDRTEEPLHAFLVDYTLPFPARWIRPWKRGELVSAFRQIGITIGASLEMPLVAVLGADGHLVKQWTPALDLKEVEAALQSAE